MRTGDAPDWLLIAIGLWVLAATIILPAFFFMLYRYDGDLLIPIRVAANLRREIVFFTKISQGRESVRDDFSII